MAKPKLKPLGNHVIIKPLEKEEVTASGIVIPDTASKEKPQQGEVIAVGSGKMNKEGKRIPLEVKVGDKVLFSKYGPNEVDFEKETYLVAEESDILAIVE